MKKEWLVTDVTAVRSHDRFGQFRPNLRSGSHIVMKEPALGP